MWLSGQHSHIIFTVDCFLTVNTIYCLTVETSVERVEKSASVDTCCMIRVSAQMLFVGRSVVFVFA